MKFFTKTIVLILLTVVIILPVQKIESKEIKQNYSKDDISDYFSGTVSLSQNYNLESFKYLNQIKYLKNKHTNYNIQFIRTLVSLQKFDEAFAFSKSIWNKKEPFFEVDLLLGLESFINEDYKLAEKYFNKLNAVSPHNLLFRDFLGNILVSWIKASENKKEESFKYLNKVPNGYNSIKKIQNSLLQCYFDTDKTESSFKELTDKDKLNFPRYNFFLVNYLVSKNKSKKALDLIANLKESYNSNLLINQTEDFLSNKKEKNIRNFFNCKNSKDNISEIFYVMANLYSTEKNYKLSNFYLNISLFLNNKFLPNKALLAENLFYQKKYEHSKKIYNSIKKIGQIYFWYASKSIATIFLNTEDVNYSIKSLEKEFKKISQPGFVHYYELANFYKRNEYFKKSIKYYSLALKNIKKDHSLIPKILEKRGTSYERIGNWEKAEKDLIDSLDLLPDQPYVLNYLAYSWTEKKINIDKALKMLNEAMNLKTNDAYITDSIGWAYYAKKNYQNAEKYLQKAVELLPLDPTINDHYADTLWMLNKNIQARYVWSYVLKLENIEKELKDKLVKKIIFGITENL
jgi:tetratricopeptide (TPR) repeat protein